MHITPILRQLRPRRLEEHKLLLSNTKRFFRYSLSFGSAMQPRSTTATKIEKEKQKQLKRVTEQLA